MQDDIEAQKEFFRRKNKGDITPSVSVNSLYKEVSKSESSGYNLNPHDTNSSIPSTKIESNSNLNSIEETSAPLVFNIIEEESSKSIKLTSTVNEMDGGFPLPMKLSKVSLSRGTSSVKKKGKISLFKMARMSAKTFDNAQKTKSKEKEDNMLIASNGTDKRTKNFVAGARADGAAMFNQMSEHEKQTAQKELLGSMSAEMVNIFRQMHKKKKILSQLKPLDNKEDKSEIVRSNSSKSNSTIDDIAIVSEGGDDNSKDLSLLVSEEDLIEATYQLPVEQQAKLVWTRSADSTSNATPKKGPNGVYEPRYDFKGVIIDESYESSGDTKSHLSGLYHHGENPDKPGYTIQELFMLCRSSVKFQRSHALKTLSYVFENRATNIASKLKVNPELLPLETPILLRCSIDENKNMTVLDASLSALRNFIVLPQHHQTLQDWSELLYRGFETTPQILHIQASSSWYLSSQNEASEMILPDLNDGSDDQLNGDQEKCDHNLIEGLLDMQLLPRLRYILEVICPASAAAILNIFDILSHIARHSLTGATAILNTPRLMECIRSQFIEVEDIFIPNVTKVESLYKVAYSDAIHLVRNLCAAGRNISENLCRSGLIDSTKRWLIFQSSSSTNTQRIHSMDVLQLEVLKLWRITLAYGYDGEQFGSFFALLSHWITGPCLTRKYQHARAVYNLFEGLTHHVTQYTASHPDVVYVDHTASLIPLALSVIARYISTQPPSPSSKGEENCSDSTKDSNRNGTLCDSSDCGLQHILSMSGVLHFIAAFLKVNRNLMVSSNKLDNLSLENVLTKLLLPLQDSWIFRKVITVGKGDVDTANRLLSQAVASDWMHGYFRCIFATLQCNKNLSSAVDVKAFVSKACIPLVSSFYYYLPPLTYIKREASLHFNQSPLLVYTGKRHLVWAQYSMLQLLKLVYSGTSGKRSHCNEEDKKLVDTSQIALRLVQHLLPGDEALFTSILSDFIFTPATLTSPSMFGIRSTSEALQIRSVMFPFYRDNLTTTSWMNHSLSLSKHTVRQVKYISVANTQKPSLLPLESDWLMFLPLLNAAESKDPTEKELATLPILEAFVKLLRAMERHDSTFYIRQMSVERKCFLLFHILLCPSDSLFNEVITVDTAMLFRKYFNEIDERLLDSKDDKQNNSFVKRLIRYGAGSHELLYAAVSAIVERYIRVGFGNSCIALVLSYFLRVSSDTGDLSVKYRLLIIQELEKVGYLHLILPKANTSEVSYNISDFKYPVESDLNIVECYINALIGNRLKVSQSSDMYEVALHHIRTIIISENDGEEASLSWRQKKLLIRLLTNGSKKLCEDFFQNIDMRLIVSVLLNIKESNPNLLNTINSKLKDILKEEI